jgi:hypothetical protein
MSYASFLKNVPEILSQPTGIAALASLGIHGAIAFIMPLMPVESNKTKQATATTKPIALSQLSTSEQSRIPGKAPTNQPGIQTQLPPLPNQISSLPTQQQLPLGIPGTSGTPILPGTTGTTTVLPPAPPAGSNSTAFPPLSRASGFGVATLPKGTALQKFNRKDLAIDPSRYSSSPTISSRITSTIPETRSYSSNMGYGQSRSSRPERLSDLPSGTPTNVPVSPPPLAAGDMAVPPVENSLNNSQNNQVVRPDQYIAPVDKNPTFSRGGNFNIAASTPLPTFQPQSGGMIDSVNNSSGAVQPGVSGVAPQGSTPSSSSVGTSQTLASAQAQVYSQFKNEYPQGQLRRPVDLTMDKTKLESDVNIALTMDREEKIADFRFLGDAAKMPFDKQQAIRERLQQYFKENPTSTNGKGALFSFRISPGIETSTASNQNPKTTSTPQASTDIFSRLSGAPMNRSQPLTVPSVNSPTVNNLERNTSSTTAPVLPPTLPGPLKPLSRTSPVQENQNQTTLPQLPTQKPTELNNLPRTLSNVRPAPQMAPKPVSESQSTTQPTLAPSSPKNALANRLRNNTQYNESNNQLSLIEKLRKVKEQRETTNP